MSDPVLSPTTITYDPVEVISFALAAPSQEQIAPAEIVAALKRLSTAAARQPHPRAVLISSRLSALTEATAETLASAATREYDDPAVLTEDIYALRAFATDPDGAERVSRMRLYLAEAVVPDSERELALDRAIANGQVSFGVLVVEPQRMQTADLAFDHFRGVYSRRYLAFHTAHWQEMARLHITLTEARTQVRALARLNSLIELGAPVGEEAVHSYDELLAATNICPGEDLETTLEATTTCASCGISLGQTSLDDDVEATLKRMDRAIERQMSRLSSVAVRAILERSNDPRVARFLQLVQATQITTLAEVLDDDLVGYLRRFLLEARISSLLEPILDRVQHGRGEEGDTSDSLEELAEVLHRAIRGGGATLPAPPDERRQRPRKRSR